MAENTSGSGNALYFLVGGLVVVAGIGAFAYTGGHFGGHGGGKTVTEQTTTTAPSHHGEETTTTTTTEKTRP